jgi:hypothetical protein
VVSAGWAARGGTLMDFPSLLAARGGTWMLESTPVLIVLSISGCSTDLCDQFSEKLRFVVGSFLDGIFEWWKQIRLMGL